ncbi:MAG TPA: FtsX-like permease family protein [Wenzhouxiangellaceae bacterium]|nr:FtsX-like permease family protein [Wenzhouxiangellaceae bacterium]
MGGMFHLVRKNLGRKKLRTLFTLLSVIIAFVLFALLGGLNRAFTAGVELAGADRLITTHKVSFIQLMPISYVARVEGVDGVRAATHYTWFGGYFQDPRQQFGLFPTNLEKLSDIYPEYEMPPDQRERLMQDRTGLMVGQAMADLYGWEVGDQVPIFSTIWPKLDGSFAWEFEIAAIFTGTGNTADEMQAFMHYDYFNEARQFGQDMIGWIVTRIEDPELADPVSDAIDARFANSPTETKTSTEAGFAAGFAAQFGNIGLIVQMILACVFFTLLLISGNTMAQAVRERTGELAVLKTIGFSDARVTGMVLAESLLVAVVGGVIGLLLGALFVQGAASALAQFFPGLAMSTGTLAWGLLLAVALGLVTGAWPAWRAARLSVIDAMGRR